MNEERYKIQLHDRITLTMTEGGWVSVIATEDGNFVGRAPTPANLFKTPEEALADLRKHHDI
jgi:hypothetical protein